MDKERNIKILLFKKLEPTLEFIVYKDKTINYYIKSDEINYRGYHFWISKSLGLKN